VELLLIRHGESTWNAERRIQGWGDPPLSDVGRRQAHHLGLRLNHLEGIDALYSSPQQRARETAEIISQITGVPPLFDEQLREGGLGVLTGLTVEDVQIQYPEIWQQWQKNPLMRTPIPEGENHDDFRQRVTEVMEAIVARHRENDRVAVVSHGGTFNAYLMHIIGLDHRRRSPFWFNNASLSMVLLGGVRPRIALLNDTCHLEQS